jgi:transcriptional regulator with XRE-family HTH domain
MSNKLWEKRREAFRMAIKQIRKKANLTQEELAVKMGKYQSYVSKYESGERKLDYVEIVEILDACKSNMSAFDRLYKKHL